MIAIRSENSTSSDRSWVMKSTEKPNLLAQLDQLGQDLPLHHHVERRGRLVHDDDLRLEGERHRDHHALAHAAGELVRVGVQPVGRDADQLEQLRGPRAGACLLEARVGGA